MELNFKKQNQQKSYQYVVDQIEEAILNRQIQEGERLPAELKLKEMFETSRGTIREALRVLEQKGLVSVKTGVKGGATVKKAGTAPISEGIGLLIRQQRVSLESLAQFRVLLEGFVAQQAALNATQKDIKHLKEILNEADSHIKSKPDNLEHFHELDAKFHQYMAKIAGNPLIEMNLKTLHENIHIYFHRYLKFSPKLLDEDFQDLCLILKAVEQKKSDLARTLAENHVERFNCLMEEKIPKNQA